MSDLMREEFEAWTANHDYLGGVELDRTISGNYADIDMQHAWQSWQASRECLVIDLEPDDPADEGAAYLHQDFVKERIQSLGLKVKP